MTSYNPSDGAPEASLANREFLGYWRHKLRGQLTAIIGYSELLQEEVEGPGQESFLLDLGRIHTAGQQLLSLVDHNLDPEKNEAASDRVSQLVHELRTPLNAVIGYAEMLQEDADEPCAEQLIAGLKEIVGAGKDLLAVMDDFLSRL